MSPRDQWHPILRKPPSFYWMQTVSLPCLWLKWMGCTPSNAIMGLLAYPDGLWHYQEAVHASGGPVASITLGTFGLFHWHVAYGDLDMTLTALLTANLAAFLSVIVPPPAPAEAASCGACTSLQPWRHSPKVWLAWSSLHDHFHWLLFTSDGAKSKPTASNWPSTITAITLPWHILVQLQPLRIFSLLFCDQAILTVFTDHKQRNQPLWFFTCGECWEGCFLDWIYHPCNYP